MKTQTKKQIIEKLLLKYPYLKKSGLIDQTKKELKEFLDHKQN